MCQDMMSLDTLSEIKRNSVIEFLLRNYFNFIINADVQDISIKDFIQEQQIFLQDAVQNITDATNAIKPDVKKELKRDDLKTVFQKFMQRLFNKLTSYFRYHNYQAINESHDEIVEEIKVRIHKYIDEASPNLKQEFKNMLDIFRGNFYIQHTSDCEQGHTDSNGEPQVCHSECNGKKFIVPGRSSIDYSWFHFHPLVASNRTEAYLLIKNNLTHVYPLKLVGSSGKAVLTIENGPTQSQVGIIKDTKFNRDNEEGYDIYFNLNMKHDLFSVKAFENMNHTELSKQLKINWKANERLTPKDLGLIKEHTINFNIANIGNFPADIKSVSISNHGHSFNGFTIVNGTDGYSLTYTPNFKNSRVTETLIVKTKYSESQFKIHAYIPMYLIKYIDSHFRVSDLEETIGNWNYLVLFLLILFVFGLLGSEILGYISYMKQKGLRYEILQKQYLEHKEEFNSKAETKVVMLNTFIEDHDIKRAKQIHEEIFNAYASATI